MDNWYSSPIIFHNLRLEQTGNCGTVKGNRIGLPEGFSKIKLKEKGEKWTSSLCDKMQVIRIFDRKPVNLVSTVYSGENVAIGRKHWQTEEEIYKPEMMNLYNKFMGGVDCNGQLLQYSAFSRQTLKWWKKVGFRLLNLAMVNGYILYSEWFKQKFPDKRNPWQNEFRLSILKQLLSSMTAPIPQSRYIGTIVTEFGRVNGKHFAKRIHLMRRSKSVGPV